MTAAVLAHDPALLVPDRRSPPPASVDREAASVAVPALMVMLSMTLPARANRATNLVVASIYIPVMVFNAASTNWEWASFYGLSIGIEVLILAFILRSAWTWPRRTASPATLAASLDSEPPRTPQQA